ncbi:ABC transporter ATP-binding protein [Candidatus Spongiisocius sp.]|uniref:ABC transporter ATP-binding protein n=1 Tax=Candidatus Spongiisocius sp. TaxID=3101273 RepID=UPI003B598826
MRHDRDQRGPEIDRALLRRVFAYGVPYRMLLVGVLVTILVVSGLTVVPPLLIRDLVDNAIPSADVGRLTLLGVAMVVVPLISVSVGALQRWMSSRAGEGIIYDLRRALYTHLQGMSLRFFTETKTGELVSRLNNDVVGAQTAITGTFVTIVSNVVSVVAILAVMVQAEWRLTLLAVAALPLFIYPARRVGQMLRAITQRQMRHNGAMGAILNETFNVSGALLVKLFGRRNEELARFSAEAGMVRDLGVRSAVVGRWFFAALGLVGAIGTAAVFWVGGYLVIQGTMSLGTVIMFSSLLVQLYGPLSAMSNARVEFATSLVSFERVFEVLDLRQEIVERPDATDLRPVSGTVEFDGVYFRYLQPDPAGLTASAGSGEPGETRSPQSPTRRWALEDAAFRIEAGELAALVGPSGAGKTTVSYLIPRLYDVTRGAVRIDGVDVRDATTESLERSIGVVTQETFLFHDSIAANLRYAKPDATEEEIQAAARAANIHDFVASLPDGYGTVVGERGYRLSGGEKQRIALARVILEDPRILILDEATAHLDSESEALIQEALERVMVGRTSLVIAHRLSTIQAADRILVLDGGRLVEEGTHEALLETDGIYARMYRTQFRGTGSSDRVRPPAFAIPEGNGGQGAGRSRHGTPTGADWP